MTAFLGGTLIGLSAVIMLWLNGRITGISSIMSGLLTATGADRVWRLLFLLAMLAGAALWQSLADSNPAPRQDYPLGLIVVGGFLVGFGTRLGSGCTSGHGICGLALFSRRSIVATLVFMSFGFLTVFVLRHVLRVTA